MRRACFVTNRGRDFKPPNAKSEGRVASNQEARPEGAHKKSPAGRCRRGLLTIDCYRTITGAALILIRNKTGCLQPGLRGIPPIEQKTLDGWGTPMFYPSRVGDTGGGLLRPHPLHHDPFRSRIHLAGYPDKFAVEPAHVAHVLELVQISCSEAQVNIAAVAHDRALECCVLSKERCSSRCRGLLTCRKEGATECKRTYENERAQDESQSQIALDELKKSDLHRRISQLDCEDAPESGQNMRSGGFGLFCFCFDTNSKRRDTLQ